MSTKAIVTTLENIRRGKPYSVDTGGAKVQYPSTAEIIDPWLDQVSRIAVDYSVKAHVPMEAAIDQDGAEQLFFPRVLIEAKLPEDYVVNLGSERHDMIIGLLYGLDGANPKGSTYAGFKNRACLNLSVFDPAAIVTAQFTSQRFTGLYDFVENALEGAAQQKALLERVYREMTEHRMSAQELTQLIGRLAQRAHKPGQSKTYFSQMMELITVNKPFNGVNYYRDGGDYNKWEIYQAYTAKPSQRFETLARPEEVLKIYSLFSEN